MQYKPFSQDHSVVRLQSVVSLAENFLSHSSGGVGQSS